MIGGGAAGLTAAIHAADRGAQVTVLEGMEKPGKKILVTGNGRCNLTNTGTGRRGSYYSDAPETARRIVKSYPPDRTRADFLSYGLFTQEKEGGRIYPMSDRASTVLDTLLYETARRKVKVKCGEKVRSLTKEGGLFRARTEGWTYEAERVVLACGGAAAPGTGSDGSGFSLAESLGHRLIKPLPALVALTVKEQDIRALEGLRSPAGVYVYADGRGDVPAFGEVQWTAYGVSGIVVFDVSRQAVRALDAGRRVQLSIDLFDRWESERVEYVEEQMGMTLEGKTNEQVLSGFFPKKMAAFLIARAGIKKGRQADGAALRAALETARDIRLTVTGHKGFEAAQVTCGGVPLTEIDEKTMESRIVPGLYLAGELLDADGPCGGFNLQWAFSTGSIAGDSAGVE